MVLLVSFGMAGIDKKGGNPFERFKCKKCQVGCRGAAVEGPCCCC